MTSFKYLLGRYNTDYIRGSLSFLKNVHFDGIFRKDFLAFSGRTELTSFSAPFKLNLR